MSLALLQEEIARSAAETRLELWGGLSLSDPLFLGLVPLAALAVLLGAARRRQPAGRVPSVNGPLPRTPRQALLWVPRALEVAALVLVVLALARPLEGSIELTDTSEGVDIVLLIDRSSSMEERERGSRASPRRFDIARDVLAAFARRRMTDEEGAADNVALIGFARYPELLCPFTLDADAMTGILEELDTEPRSDMDGTGIGVAVAKAVDVLEHSDAKSRVVVLLTDGEETIGLISPLDAARVAAEEGIKVYSVFVGPRFLVRRTLMADKPVVRIPVEVGDLPEMAELTGAKFFHAEDAEELEEVYAAIEALERTPREERRFAEQYDLYSRLLWPAFFLYLAAWLSVFTWARRLP